MESTDTPRSALDELKDVTFKQGMRGYSIAEVDDFLDRAATDYEKVRDRLSQQHQQLRQAAERIAQLQATLASTPSSSAPAPSPAPAPAPVAPVPAPAPAPAPAPVVSRDASGEIAEMIAMAQHFVADTRTEAVAKAREVTQAAQDRAREIVTEAKSRAEDEVTRLNGLKQRLSEEIASLTRQLEVDREQLLGVLSELTTRVNSSLRLGHGAHVAEATSAGSSAQTISQALHFDEE